MTKIKKHSSTPKTCLDEGCWDSPISVQTTKVMKEVIKPAIMVMCTVVFNSSEPGKFEVVPLSNKDG